MFSALYPQKYKRYKNKLGLSCAKLRPALANSPLALGS